MLFQFLYNALDLNMYILPPVIIYVILLINEFKLLVLIWEPRYGSSYENANLARKGLLRYLYLVSLLDIFSWSTFQWCSKHWSCSFSLISYGLFWFVISIWYLRLCTLLLPDRRTNHWSSSFWWFLVLNLFMYSMWKVVLITYLRLVLITPSVMF